MMTKDRNGVQSATLSRAGISKLIHYFNFLQGAVRNPHRISDPLWRWDRRRRFLGISGPAADQLFDLYEKNPNGLPDLEWYFHALQPLNLLQEFCLTTSPPGSHALGHSCTSELEGSRGWGSAPAMTVGLDVSGYAARLCCRSSCQFHGRSSSPKPYGGGLPSREAGPPSSSRVRLGRMATSRISMRGCATSS